MTNKLIAIQRLRQQRIQGQLFDSPEAVVRWLGAMQAQDYAQAVWAIGLRTRSASLAQVEQAIAERKILRTWPMRGTIHFVPAQDARWMLRLCAQRQVAADRRRQQDLELNEAILERSKQLFYDALHGDRRLARPEMLQLLENAGISTAGQRGYHILAYAAQTGLICLGPMQQKQQTFVLLEEWAPGARDLPREEALAELAGRYFCSHGPATVQDFARWAALTLTEARAGLAAARGALTSETVDGTEYWLAKDALQPSAPASDAAAGAESAKDGGSVIDARRVFLLPGYDEYLLGYANRDAVLASDYAPKIVPGGNGVFFPMLVVGGLVLGTWKRAVKKNALEITFTPFEPPAFAEEDLLAAVQRYCDFLDLPLSKMIVEVEG